MVYVAVGVGGKGHKDGEKRGEDVEGAGAGEGGRGVEGRSRGVTLNSAGTQGVIGS